MAEGVFLALFAASVKHSIITEKIVDNTATGGTVNEEKDSLLTRIWHPPDIRDTTISFIIDKENYVSRGQQYKEHLGNGNSILRIKTLKP